MNKEFDESQEYIRITNADIWREVLFNRAKTPDWAKWQYLGECTISNAVLLAHDVCPDKHGHDFERLLIDGKNTFFKLFDIAKSLTETVPQRLKTNSNGKVNLAEFADLARSIGFDLPDEFPRVEIVSYENKVIDKKPIPIKGKSETLIGWIKYVLVHEKGLSLDDEMPMGLQSELIKRAVDYNYKDESSIKRAWKKLGLKSVKR